MRWVELRWDAMRCEMKMGKTKHDEKQHNVCVVLRSCCWWLLVCPVWCTEKIGQMPLSEGGDGAASMGETKEQDDEREPQQQQKYPKK